MTTRAAHDRVHPPDANSLETLRARLDQIDARLLDTLRERMECCIEIADFKREHGVAMMQPIRIGMVHQRAARYAGDHGIDQDFLRNLYELIIEETCRVEDLVIANLGAGSFGTSD